MCNKYYVFTGHYKCHAKMPRMDEDGDEVEDGWRTYSDDNVSGIKTYEQISEEIGKTFYRCFYVKVE